MNDRILILDFGSQVTQLIARRVRESGVYCEILPFNVSDEKIRDFKPKGIILSGGPASVSGEASPKVNKIVFKMELPILGICYGQQGLCDSLGGTVATSDHREFGRAQLEIKKDSSLYKGIWETGKNYQVWMSHGDRITQLPKGFEVIATTEGAPFAAIADEKRHYYGVQFHPEVMHTPDGAKLLHNFTHAICGCSGDWSMEHFHTEAISKIRREVGTDRVLCAVSGGVDSSVVAKLLHEAIGDQLICVFVNTGLLREGEGEEVRKRYAENYHVPLTYVDASRLFLQRLAGVSDPERKRKIIGAAFIEVFEQEVEKAGGADYLAQGTLYPDVIESVSFTGGPSVTIKSHHNVGGLPDHMKLKLIEPVRELFKDEVRALGEELGMAKDLLARHPFPGPGLGIRIPGEVTEEKANILRKADAVYLDEIRKAGLYDEIWQAFAVLLPVRTVGVMGDNRTYDYACALRAVTSTDGMTADYYPFSHEFLGRAATRIINEVRGINRVVYDITSKPPGTIEWE
ncbi:MAG: glutamine-hydrolyzing GMP synthase [Rickettsiales bacterium]|nr:glutamine-hydrolyzing GMP synthase [Rickettsiales bacterium]